MPRRNLGIDRELPPAVLEARQERDDATGWVSNTVQKIIESDDNYTAYTTSDVLKIVDRNPDQPRGYAVLVAWPDTSSYKTRYAMVRNALESMFRAKTVHCGTTINKLGVEGSTTYARIRDNSANWVIDVDVTGSAEIQQSIENSLRDWIRTQCPFPELIRRISMTNKYRPISHEAVPKAVPPSKSAPPAGQRRPPGRPKGSKNRPRDPGAR